MNQESTTPPFTRRGFLASSAVLLGTPALAASVRTAAKSPMTQKSTTEPKPAEKPAAANGPFELPPLPYKEDALEPHISAKTMGFHYGKHHKGYIDKLNAAVQGKKLAEMKLEAVIEEAAKDTAMAGVFNSAAQAWNHTFYWKSMTPKGGGEPKGKLADMLKSDIGGLEGFRKEFGEAANGQFGSGWAWLVVEGGKLKVLKTSNADTPIARGGKPLLVIDVWEHAYYLDYQNKRADYVLAFIEHLVNWEFAAANLG